MNHARVFFFLLAATTLLAGCNPRLDDFAAVADTEIVGPEYSATRGLFVPDDTRRSIGLKIADIAEQHVSTAFVFSLRIYEIAGGTARASAMLPPSQAGVLKSGQPVEVDGPAGIPVAARITGVNPHVSQATGMVEVLAEIPLAAGELATGTFLNARVTLESDALVVTVPRTALVRTTEGYSVYTVSGDHFVRTSVKVGAINAELAEITDGLYAGDQVVSEPVMSLWLTELAAVKGGHPCCVVPAKGK
jgi:multidrug efflux pump subunit AcrA (membrane-fusion protein)